MQYLAALGYKGQGSHCSIVYWGRDMLGLHGLTSVCLYFTAASSRRPAFSSRIQSDRGLFAVELGEPKSAGPGGCVFGVVMHFRRSTVLASRPVNLCPIMA